MNPYMVQATLKPFRVHFVLKERQLQQTTQVLACREDIHLCCLGLRGLNPNVPWWSPALATHGVLKNPEPENLTP